MMEHTGAIDYMASDAKGQVDMTITFEKNVFFLFFCESKIFLICLYIGY